MSGALPGQAALSQSPSQQELPHTEIHTFLILQRIEAEEQYIHHAHTHSFHLNLFLTLNFLPVHFFFAENVIAGSVNV